MTYLEKYKKYKLKYLQIKYLKGGGLTNADIDNFINFLEIYNISYDLKEDINNQNQNHI